MEIWPQSPHIESCNRIIAALPQARAQHAEVPFQPEVTLSMVDYGELLITIIKGQGYVQTAEEKIAVSQGDQIYLQQGDEFALSAGNPEDVFAVQTLWGENIAEQLL